MKVINFIIRWVLETKHNQDAWIDEPILFSAIILAAFGIIMVYSASIPFAMHDSGSQNSYYYVIRHIIYILAGATAGGIAFYVPTSFWRKNAVKIAVLIILLLVAVLIPHVGKTVNGAKRWIGIGLLSIQPSEIAKLGMAIYLSDYVCGKTLSFKHFWNDLFPVLLAIGIVSILLLAEPDMGSTTVVFIIALGILYMADIDKRFITGLTLVGAISFVGLIIAAPYRMRRVLGFINPWQDALGKGYQLTHSLLAVGHGGWIGAGLGNSIEKLSYLPEAHTDFILAIIAEETGALGVLCILLFFWIIFYRGFKLIGNEARHLANRQFQSLLAQGISLWFFAQALVNIGVTIGVLPTKGLTLPFISFGGSSILISCVALGILLKIDYENRQIKRGIVI
jgi:cell division protein FtsW